MRLTARGGPFTGRVPYIKTPKANSRRFEPLVRAQKQQGAGDNVSGRVRNEGTWVPTRDELLQMPKVRAVKVVMT